MKYLINWVIKELHPSDVTNSKTTNSVYFSFFDNIQIRISDHLGKASDDKDNNLQIIISKDLFGNNKQFIIKESDYPTMMTLTDIKSVKMVLGTYLWHYKNMYDRNNVNKVKSGNSKSELIFSNFIKKYLKNDISSITKEDLDAYNQVMTTNILQWQYLPKEVRDNIIKLFFIDSTVNGVKYIINNIYKLSDYNHWKKKSYRDLLLMLTSYFSKYELNEKPGMPAVCKKINDVNTTSTEYETEIEVIDQKKRSPIELLKMYQAHGINNLDDVSKNNMKQLFGNLMKADTNCTYTKLTDAQKKEFREMLNFGIPYDIILNFYKSTINVKKNRCTPHVTDLRQLICRFLNLYNVGIIKYPTDTDFNTVSTDGLTKTKNIDIIFNTETSLINIINKDDLDNYGIDVNKNNNIIDTLVNDNNVVVKSEEEIKETIEKYTKLDNSIEKTNGESIYNIPDITSTFKQTHLDIINTVINDIKNRGDNVISYDNQRIMDVFAEHYEKQWKRMTNTQKELSASIMTEEKMTLNETDYIINKIYDKRKLVWPTTELVRIYIQEYCRRIRENRIAA